MREPPGSRRSCPGCEVRRPGSHSAVQRGLGLRSASTLIGNAGQVAKSKLPPAAEKTEKLRGAFIPNASVIARPNVIRSIPLHNAVIRVCQPARRRRPSKISAQVARTASAGIIACGKNQLSWPVYSTNLAKLPQATFGWPNAPHQPKRSATAERKDSPRANRMNTELRLANLSHHVFIDNSPIQSLRQEPAPFPCSEISMSSQIGNDFAEIADRCYRE